MASFEHRDFELAQAVLRVAPRTDQGGVVEHSEFIVYKESQCLPEFAIWYKHKDGCNCTHCCGLDVD